ncbi:MAG: galactokinase [Phycisphaerae bacterium]|nr:galactokinase [Phycisphaerae bacterium]
MNLRALQRDFQSLYGRPAAGAVRAPGRVNLIGEHTDYNDGFVLPIAISRQTLAAYARRDDRIVHFASKQAESQIVPVDLAAPIARAEPTWANYCRGVAAGLLAAGVELTGADVLFDSDVPLGGGLSSSAALEVATALVLLEAAGARGAVAAADLARLCQKAEHDFAGAPCGIMDQSIAIMGQAGRAMLLDCRGNEVRHVPFDDPDGVLLVADTQVRHAISGGAYALRRQQCHADAAALGAKALREVDLPAVQAALAEGKLDAPQFKRARHVAGEIARTLQAVQVLGEGDHKRFGQLMTASHVSLRDDYEVSCEELDAIVDAALPVPGVHGARMTGGGFGGCAIILAHVSQAERITRIIQEAFAARFGRRCPIFATPATAGAGPLAME